MPITLLLADDSVVIQKLVGLSFANEDIDIITVDNGDDAVSRAKEAKPDMILADVVMPGKNGYEVCAEIRKNPELASTPVLLLTGTFEAFDEARAGDVGATGHITKPFEAQALVDRVNEILAQQPAATASPAPTAANSDFFDQNVGNLAGDPAMETPANASPSHDFAFGGSPTPATPATPGPAAPAPMAEPGAETVVMPQGAGLEDLLDSAGGDHTVAIIPEPSDDDWMANPQPTPIAQMSPPVSPKPSAPVPPVTPNPDQTMLVDDFLGDADPMLPYDAPSIPSIPSSPGMPAAEIPPTDDLDLDGLSFGSQPSIPSVDLDGPGGDDTVLADDLFGSDDDLDSSLRNAVTDPVRPQPLAASQGLDIDFGGASIADSIVPDNANDYDVSSSDLDVDPMADDSSWGAAGVPTGVQTGPAPITPPRDLAPPPASAPDPMSLDDVPSRGLEPDWNAPDASPELELESTPWPEPPPPTVDLGVTSGVVTPEPPPVPVATREVEATSESKPDLSPAMQDRIHDTLEKVAWEAFSDLSEDVVRQLMQRVEQIAWEVIPQMAETLIRDEIRKMKAEEGDE